MDFVVTAEELKSLVKNKFTIEDISELHAEITADVLVHANLRKIDSHGVLRTHQYIKRIKSGGINVNPDIKVELTGKVTAMVDGDNALGQVVAERAMSTAIDLAEENGVGMVGVKNSEHCGALSYFIEMATHDDMIGIGTTNANKLVAPFGGAEPFFGTNPLAFGFPSENKDPIILDMATSKVAYGKVLDAKEKGQKIPSDWGLDRDGKVTTNPEDIAVLLPIAGPKGYGLSMVVDILSGILTGSPNGSNVLPFADYESHRNLGHFFIVINPDMFIGKGPFKLYIDNLINELHNQMPAEGFDGVMVPGELEQNMSKKQLKEGITIPKNIYHYLTSESV